MTGENLISLRCQVVPQPKLGDLRSLFSYITFYITLTFNASQNHHLHCNEIGSKHAHNSRYLAIPIYIWYLSLYRDCHEGGCKNSAEHLQKIFLCNKHNFQRSSFKFSVPFLFFAQAWHSCLNEGSYSTFSHPLDWSACSKKQQEVIQI